MTRRSFQQLFATLAAASSLDAAHRLRLGIGTYTYHNSSIEDMIGQLKRLKITEIEMSRGEFMLFSKPTVEKCESFKRKIDEAGIRCVSYYAATFKTEDDVTNSIRFAKALGAGNITGDGKEDVLRLLEKRLPGEGLTFGLHNHFFKQKFDYESPEDLVNMLNRFSPVMGCTLDIGHIVSCGYDTVDAVRKLGARIRLVHLKDIEAAGDEVNVPLGTGLSKIPQVMLELHKLNFKGLVAFEYEKEGQIYEDVAKQIAYARKLL